jgi:DNA (cytosine-5)-methyltransferase 1
VSLTVASLASGSGALEMALELWLGGGLDLRWHAEIDPDASLVLKTHRPAVPNLGDFTVPGFWESAERCDVMAGGIPCQPFSAAGRQLGEADARHLWPFWREGIALHRPATVVFENVANLTRGKMRPTFDSIIGDLLALGYDVRWCLLGACAVGAAHHRHRVFLLACRSRTTPNAAQVTVRTCGQHAAAYLPTPSAVSYGSNQGGGAGRTGPVRHSLDALARLKLLPTTTARDASTRGEGSEEFWEAKRAADWTGGVPLGAALSLLPTPRAIDAARGPVTPERTEASGRRNGVELASALQLLPTPRHSDAKNGGPN